MSKVNILIVEDESIVAMDIERRLKTLGYSVLGHVMSGEDAVVRSEKDSPDLVLMDIHLKGKMDGIEAADKIRMLYDIPVIYITAYSDEATLERAKVTEPFGYILKPFQEREIHSAIEMAMYKHRAEQELREAKEAAVEGYKARSSFLANISHELRTPLNSILGMTDLAMETEQKEERNEYLRTVRESGSHLLNLINSILDFSKMEKGKLEIVEESFRLDELIESELKGVWNNENRDDLSLYIDIDERSTFSLTGDATRLRQVLRNLVQNAIKFTGEGYVYVKAYTEEVSGVGNKLLHVQVSDTGIGIPKEEEEEIFSMFYQLDNSYTKVHGGAGLGLAIVKNLVELMGGQIKMESEEDKGSSFYVTIPVKEDRNDTRAPLTIPESTRVHIISADEFLSDIIRRRLEVWGAEVKTQHSQKILGTTDDIWCVGGNIAFGKQVVGKLNEKGVSEERIIRLAAKTENKFNYMQSVQILSDPQKRLKLYEVLSNAAKHKNGKIQEIELTMPRGYDQTSEEEEEKTEEDRSVGEKRQEEKHFSQKERDLVGRIMETFISTAKEQLQKEDFIQFEEHALEIKKELETYGFYELRDILFRAVLAARKYDSEKVKNLLDNLKERSSSLRLKK